MIPKVSVITTVYNCEQYIGESVQSILDQTFTEFEYLIVDDGSTDKTLKTIKRYAEGDGRVTIIENEKNLGRVVSLNNALEKARGRYIAIQDADDISLPERLQKQYNFLNKYSDYVICGSNIVNVNDEGHIIASLRRLTTNKEIKFSLLFRCTFANPSVMFEKRILDEHDLKYEEEFIHAEDFRILSLISQYGNVHNLDEYLVKYRSHPENNSVVNFQLLDTNTVKIIKENLKRIDMDISLEQCSRLRNLIRSRNIDEKNLVDDIDVLLNVITNFQKKQYRGDNIALLNLFKRMTRWVGKKRILTNPKFLILFFKIKLSKFKF